jgi:predicted transposase/invertase (TIGR01784 family)
MWQRGDKERVFEKLAREEAACVSREDYNRFERKLKTARDWFNVLDTAYEEGIKAGIEEGRKEYYTKIARKLLATGTDETLISELTGLRSDEIQSLH